MRKKRQTYIVKFDKGTYVFTTTSLAVKPKEKVLVRIKNRSVSIVERGKHH